jgi:hypothetical protein
MSRSRNRRQNIGVVIGVRVRIKRLCVAILLITPNEIVWVIKNESLDVLIFSFAGFSLRARIRRLFCVSTVGLDMTYWANDKKR